MYGCRCKDVCRCMYGCRCRCRGRCGCSHLYGVRRGRAIGLEAMWVARKLFLDVFREEAKEAMEGD